MTEFNYLPFVGRQSMVLAAGEVKKVAVIATAIKAAGKGENVYYQDIITDSYTEEGAHDPEFFSTPVELSIRYGYKGRGFLAEEPLGFYRYSNNDAMTPGYVTAGWNFQKPYKMWPGQQLIAAMRPTNPEFLGIALHGYKVTNGEPVTLYGAHKELTTLEQTFSGENMQCPTDSPINIESLQFDSIRTGSPAANPYCRLWDANGRDIVQYLHDPAFAALNRDEFYRRWHRPGYASILLGERLGWKLPKERELIVEYENKATSSVYIMVTVRGCAEVEI